jgi:type I restriction-modification system DNA methylase subunit
MNAADADPFVLKTRPRGTADELWVSREVESLKPGGLSVVLVPEGILSKHSAYEMRNSLLRECALEGIIALPPGAFKNAGILRSSILIFRRKSKDVQQRKSVFVSELNNIDYRVSKDMACEFNEVVADFRFYQERGY